MKILRTLDLLRNIFYNIYYHTKENIPRNILCLSNIFNLHEGIIRHIFRIVNILCVIIYAIIKAMITYEKIKELSKLKGTNISNVERECGFSKGSLSKIEKNQPSMERVEKLANFFGVSVSFLCGDNEIGSNELMEISQKQYEESLNEKNLLALLRKYPELKEMILAGGKIIETNKQLIESMTYTLKFLDAMKYGGDENDR